MRPRVFPAEDSEPELIGAMGTGASMRPRVFPAEDSVAASAGETAVSASMRPRVFPAEDLVSTSSLSAFQGSFNEAAGIPRGRRNSTPI